MRTLLAILLLVPMLASAYGHPGGIVNPEQIAKAQQALAAGAAPWVGGWNTANNRCNPSGLAEVPSAVADFSDPGYYEDPVGHDAVKSNLSGDVNAAFACALAAKIGYNLTPTVRDTYRAKARDLINNWASVNTTASNDNGKLVMCYVATAFMTTAELLYDDPLWTTAERAQFSTWADNVLFTAGEFIAEDNNNNWASWGSLCALASAYWRNDTTDFAARVVRLKEIISSQIAADGSLPLELARTGDGEGALWYTYFSLAPMSHAVWLVRNATGEDLFNYTTNTGTIPEAIEYFHQLALDPSDYVPPDQPPPVDHRSWGGDLLYVMGSYLGNVDQRHWANHPQGPSNAAWKASDLLYGFQPITCAPTP